MDEVGMVPDRLLRDAGRGRAKLVLAVSGAAVLALTALAAAPAHAAANPAAGTVTVLAGGAGGPGPGTQTALANPCDVVSVGGHLLVSDAGSDTLLTYSAVDPQIVNVVRDVNERTGWLRTMAGVGVPGLPGQSGVGGPARQASFDASVCSMAVDRAGNLILEGGPGDGPLVIAAKSGEFYGQRMRAGDLYSLESGVDGASVAVDYAGNLVIAVPGRTDFDPINASVQVIAEQSGTFYGQAMTAGQTYPIGSLDSASIGDVTVDGSGNPVVDEGSMVAIAARAGTFDGRKMKAGRPLSAQLRRRRPGGRGREREPGHGRRLPG